MDQEISLQKKINLLQAQMMEFNKRISPAKKELTGNLSSECSSTYNFQAVCSQIIITVVKTFLCFAGPILFPTMVYCIEGSSVLFWQVMLISTLIVFLLATMAFSELQSFVEHVKMSICEFSNMCFKQKRIKIIQENKLPAVNTHVLMFLIAATLLSILTYRMSILILFYVCLVSAGFLLGILTMQMYEQFKTDDKLPHYSPCNIKFNLIDASPPPKGLKRLSLTDEKKENSMSLEQSLRHVTSQRRLDFTGMQYTLRPQIPNTPPPSYQEAVDSTQNQPLMNLNYFFRTP